MHRASPTALNEAHFRADQVYTTQIPSAVWIDPELLRVSLVPGSQEPGVTWSEAPYIDSAERPYAVAAFDGGFGMPDAHGRAAPDAQEPGRIPAAGRRGPGHVARRQPRVGHLQLLRTRPRRPVIGDRVKLYPQMRRPADRYLGPARETRDFFLVSLPPTGGSAPPPAPAATPPAPAATPPAGGASTPAR